MVILFSMLPGFLGCVANDAHRTRVQADSMNLDSDSRVEHYTKALVEHPNDTELVIFLQQAKQRASEDHMRKAERLIEKRYFRKAIEELQMSIAFYPANARAVTLIDHVKRKKESFYYYGKGERFVKNGRFPQAREAFKKAIELNPDNVQAQKALDNYRKKDVPPPEYRLTLRSNAPVSLKFKQTPVINVFEILSKLTGVNFIFDKDMKDSKVTLFMTDVKFDTFLDVLLKTNGLKAKMINRKTMLIYPDTPSKAKEYDELFVKTFYLSHLKAKKAVGILAKIIKAKKVIANEELNSVTVRGKKASVEMAARIFDANDRTPAEAILNVEIIEVRRTKEKNLGLSISDTINFGVSETSSGIKSGTGVGFAPMASLDDIGDITSKELYLSLPTATLKLLKQDGETKTLAKPQVRVSNHEKASIHIGERIPLRSNRKVQTDGSTTYDYLYQEVGIKLKAEPVINMHDQISMKLNLEVSSLGNNVGTVDDPQYAIKTRTTDTVISIRAGDSVIIGGLISDEERSTLRKIPLLGDVPAMGRIFSNNDGEIIETDILMTITPVIIRSQDIPTSDAAGFWSGSERRVSLEPPFEGRVESQTGFNDYPDEDYIMVMEQDEFLPSDRYFSIQVNSFKDVKDAEKRAVKLETLGYKVWVKSAEIPDTGVFHRVFVEQYESYSEADEAASKMRADKEFDDDIHIVDRDYVYGE
jgi:general secretion pathway protein D